MMLLGLAYERQFLETIIRSSPGPTIAIDHVRGHLGWILTAADGVLFELRSSPAGSEGFT